MNSGEAFSIEFDDSLGTQAGILEFSELTSFSGITYQVNAAGTLFSHSNVFDWPEIAGVAVDTGFPFNAGWRLGDAFVVNTLGANLFSYNIRANEVPLPAGFLLLLTGIGGLTITRRMKART